MEKVNLNDFVRQNSSVNKQVFKDGMRDGIPIALGYLAVSFSLGIAAKNAGLSAFQGFLASLLTNASAGEYAGFTVIATMATYLEMFLVILIANSRYLIMSCALSQRMHPDTPWYHRLLIGFDITDELFAITIARPGYLNPFYTVLVNRYSTGDCCRQSFVRKFSQCVQRSIVRNVFGCNYSAITQE